MLLFQGHNMQSGAQQAGCWAGAAAHQDPPIGGPNKSITSERAIGRVNDLLSPLLVVG
jgi:hypothetical protein